MLSNLMKHRTTAFSLFFSDIPHFVRRDIFAFAKVILRLRRSDILFAINICKANITRLKAVYHCEAIELAARRIELKRQLQRNRQINKHKSNLLIPPQPKQGGSETKPS